MFRNPLTDSIVALVVLLLIFGPKRLPVLGRSLGHGLREFKDSITGRADDQQPEQHALMPAQSAPVSATSPVRGPSPQ